MGIFSAGPRRKTTSRVVTHTGDQFRVPVLPHVRVFGLREAAGIAGEEPHRLRKNMHSSHLRVMSEDGACDLKVNMEPITFDISNK